MAQPQRLLPVSVSAQHFVSAKAFFVWKTCKAICLHNQRMQFPVDMQKTSDRKGFGLCINAVHSYEWGYTYGEPMAVAPIDKVRQVLDYAVMEMPPEKILMGMANYGYSWTLPYRKRTAARPLSLSEIPQTAYSQYADIRFDDTAQSPFFRYYDSAGTEHIAWFEDPRSIEAKLKLVSEYGLGGVSYWNINTLYRPNWAVLSGMYGIEKVFGQG